MARRFTAYVSVVWLVVWAGAVGVSAQATDPIRIAVVDVQKVVDSYRGQDHKLAEIDQWAQLQAAYVNELQESYCYLSEENFNEVLDIMRMPRPLAAKWAKRERELKEISSQKETRFLDLRDKVERTPAEQEEFNQLQEIYNARLKQIEAIKQDLEQQYRAKSEEALGAIRTAILTAVKEVSAEGKYTLVLNKALVINGGEDITDAVIKKLGGTPPTEGTPAPAEGAPAGGSATPSEQPAGGGATPAPQPPTGGGG